jgi:hypothetical protein
MSEGIEGKNWLAGRSRCICICMIMYNYGGEQYRIEDKLESGSTAALPNTGKQPPAS